MYDKLNENGIIIIYDAETEEAKYRIPAPYMYDANGEISYAVEYTLVEASNGRYLLMVTADKTWINAKDREFPVTIDPTVTQNISMCDTYVSYSSPNASYFASSELLIGAGNTAFMQLYVPILPSGALIEDVYLYMFCYFASSSGNALSVGAYEKAESWHEEFVTYNDLPSISSQILSTVDMYDDMGTAEDPYLIRRCFFCCTRNLKFI